MRFTERASRDLDDIGDWIAAGDPDRAAEFLLELRGKALAIGSQPRAFPLVSGRRDEARRRLYSGYLIFYVIADDEVAITRVLHGARDYSNLL